jgi:hypothetical protein
LINIKLFIPLQRIGFLKAPLLGIDSTTYPLYSVGMPLKVVRNYKPSIHIFVLSLSLGSLGPALGSARLCIPLYPFVSRAALQKLRRS